MQKLKGSLPKSAPALAQIHRPLHPPKQRMWIPLLRLNIDRLVVICGIENDRKIERVRHRPREARILVRTPLHWCPPPLAVAQKNILAHDDFIAVVKDRSAGQREEQEVKQFDSFAIISQE